MRSPFIGSRRRWFWFLVLPGCRCYSFDFLVGDREPVVFLLTVDSVGLFVAFGTARNDPVLTARDSYGVLPDGGEEEAGLVY